MGLETRIISAPLNKSAQSLLGKYSGELAILAGGKSVWDDYRGCGMIPEVMAVNDVGMFFPYELEHWFSLHGDQLRGWHEVRQFHHKSASWLHTTQQMAGCIQWPVPSSGTSTLSAIYVALCLGYEKIVLCGAPLDNGPHFFEADWAETNFANEARHDVWERARDTIFEGRVKSMSGVSREILGGP